MIKKIYNVLLPSKKVFFLLLAIIILGIISGSVFLVIININDKNLVINKIKSFIENLNNAKINNFDALKNAISTNLLYVIIIFILGFTIIGALFNIFIVYIKSFITGFTLASFIISYNYKGIILSFLYVIFGQLLNLIVILCLTSYSIIFSIKLINLIFKNKPDNKFKRFLKHNFIIFLIMIIISIISSFFEAYIFTSLIKLIIKLFI